MTIAQYLCAATSLGLSRRDALLMEIATVYDMARMKGEMGQKKGKREFIEH